MGFLADFATGFFQTSANTLDRRQQLREEIDLDRKKRINEVNAKKELLEYESRINEEEELRKFKRLQEQRKSYDQGGLSDLFTNTQTTTPTTGTGKVDVPKIDNGLMEQKFKNAAANAALYGDDDAYKANQARADIFSTRRSIEQQQREQGRQPTLGATGTPIAAEYAKSEAERLSQGGSTKFLPERASMTGSSPEAENTRRLEMESSGMAQKLVATIADQTANPATGVSRLTGPTIQNLAEQIVILRNKIALSKDPDAVTDDLLELNKKVQELNSYSEGLGDSVYQGLFNDLPSNDTTEPVVLKDQSGQDINQPSRFKEGTTIINREIGERMVYRNGTWQPL